TYVINRKLTFAGREQQRICLQVSGNIVDIVADQIGIDMRAMQGYTVLLKPFEIYQMRKVNISIQRIVWGFTAPIDNRRVLHLQINILDITFYIQNSISKNTIQDDIIIRITLYLPILQYTPNLQMQVI